MKTMTDWELVYGALRILQCPAKASHAIVNRLMKMNEPEPDDKALEARYHAWTLANDDGAAKKVVSLMVSLGIKKVKKCSGGTGAVILDQDHAEAAGIHGSELFDFRQDVDGKPENN